MGAFCVVAPLLFAAISAASCAKKLDVDSSSLGEPARCSCAKHPSLPDDRDAAAEHCLSTESSSSFQSSKAPMSSSFSCRSKVMVSTLGGATVRLYCAERSGQIGRASRHRGDEKCAHIKATAADALGIL